MAEEKKPAEEKKMEAKKPEEEAKKQTKEEKKPEIPQEKAEYPPEKDSKESKEPEEEEKKPQEIVLRVFMHCEGCARKVRHCLKGFDGVEDVATDCKNSTVVVKGEKADPLKVLERVQRKSHRQVELLSPVPKPKEADEPEKKQEENPKAEEKKEPQLVTVVLRVHMHCEACAMEIQKRIQRMKGVESAEPDLKASQVTVKGVFESPKLVQYVYKRTGKHAAIISQDPPPKTAEIKKEKKEETEKKGGKEEAKEEKKLEEKEGKEEKKEEENKKETKDGGGGVDVKADDRGNAAAEEPKAVEIKTNEYYYHQPPRYPMELYAYPPQIFSDENPNACTVM